MTEIAGSGNRARSKGAGWGAHAVALVLVALHGFVVVSGGTAELVKGWTFYAFLLITIVVGWLITWKRPRNPLGWLLLAVPALFVTWLPVGLLGEQLLQDAPGVASWLLWYGWEREDTWAWIPPLALLFTQIPLRFPDGRLPSPRWRWFSWYTVGALALACFLVSMSAAEVYPGVPNPTRLVTREEMGVWLLVGLFLALTCFGGAIASLFVRYHRADSLQRAQLRWMFWATSSVITALVASWFAPDSEALNSLVLLLYGLIPVSILIAVLRYRLYEIDRIISRTASYAIVTLLLAGAYALVVISVTAVLPGLPAVGVAVATLAAAGLFLPLLHRVRRIVDRRFDREQYDAAKLVDAFGERLRSGADPHHAGVELVTAVEQALQPVAVGLWTRRDAPR